MLTSTPSVMYRQIADWKQHSSLRFESRAHHTPKNGVSRGLQRSFEIVRRYQIRIQSESNSNAPIEFNFRARQPRGAMQSALPQRKIQQPDKVQLPLAAPVRKVAQCVIYRAIQLNHSLANGLQAPWPSSPTAASERKSARSAGNCTSPSVRSICRTGFGSESQVCLPWPTPIRDCGMSEKSGCPSLIDLE
jgi:hypothetical protein